MAVSTFTPRAQRGLSLTELQRRHRTAIQVALSQRWSSAHMESVGSSRADMLLWLLFTTLWANPFPLPQNISEEMDSPAQHILTHPDTRDRQTPSLPNRDRAKASVKAIWAEGRPQNSCRKQDSVVSSRSSYTHGKGPSPQHIPAGAAPHSPTKP